MIDQCQSFIFDCDGVILDSNRIKTNAFRNALADEDERLVDEFIQYHQDNGGVSRYIKFQYYFDHIKKQQDNSQAVTGALKRYSVIVRKALLNVDMIDGVEYFLKHCHSNNKQCFVNSGGDQKELLEVFKERGIAYLFTKILGSPATKEENLALLMAQNCLSGPTMFFGDAHSDYKAAKAFNLHFVYVSGASEWGDGEVFCVKKDIHTISDFTQIILD